MTVSNQPLTLSYEPETVDDQDIIDAYGGLDNTPAYLIKLRPQLLLNDEQIAVASDGLAMGSEYTIQIKMESPAGSDQVSVTQTAGSLAAVGIVSQLASSTTTSLLTDIGNGLSAEQILQREAYNYIDRWNQAETELSALLRVAIARPIPTLVMVGGVADVTYLLDQPHGYTPTGVYLDAVRCKKELGCSGAEIARHLGVNTRSINRAVEQAESKPGRLW